MSRRHRVTFEATPVWHAGPATREPVDLSGHEHLPSGPEAPIRGWHRFMVVVAALVVAAPLAVAVTDDDERADPRPATTAPPAAGPTGAGRDPPRIFIDGHEVIAPPYRGSVNRYWSSDGDRAVVRAHAISLRGAAGAGALLVVDATRRANVHGAGAAHSPLGVPVRVLQGADGIRTLEWDRPGWGLSLTTTGLALADGLRVVDAVGLPAGASLLSGLPPDLDVAVLAELGVEVTDHRESPASGVGGPLVGQSGLDAVEAYVYRPDVGQPASLLLTGALGASVRAAELASALGRAVVVDPPWRDGGVAVAFELRTDVPVGYRITGQRRVVFDHPAGVTFWLASDQLSMADLLAAGGSIDFDRIALRMTRT